MIRPDFRKINHSNELYHYGMPRRSGRYPYGSGDRPFQDKKKRINYSNTISKEIYDKINKIKSSLSEKEKRYVGKTSISDYTKYANVKNGAYIILDDYGGKFRDVHPYDGLVISIAATSKARGSGTTNDLINEAKEKNQGSRLLAEIDSDNLYSKNLFKRNGFEYLDSFNDIDVYYWEKDLKHSSESEVKFKMNNIYYLSHGGPGSGRYPLGSGERPYQKFEGSRRRSSSISDYIKSRKQKRKQDEENRKRLEYEEAKRLHDLDKERVLKKGTATEVLKYQGELTNQELQNAFYRLNLESQLKNLSQKEMKSAIDKFDKVMKTIKTGTDWIKIATDSYNAIAAIYNATPEGKKNSLTLIKKEEGKKK